ncbi:MAG: hypothetical protein HY275_09530 [Gemmatimonadetes bacterium]|nr:hypothetical protein [Gemmatimonadota bacterium]
MRLRPTLLLLALALPRAHAQRAGAPSTVTLERVAPDRWRATYRLAHAASSLRFERSGGFFRERSWKVVTPGYHLARAGGAQVAAADSGRPPLAELVFEFAPFTANLPKEYEFFLPFTGGAVAIYTGHLNAIADSGRSDSARVRRLHVIPPADAHAILRGRVTNGPVTWTDTTGEGTYIYLGRATPIETPDVLALVDPGVPAWLQQQFARELPRLFTTYRRQFGVALPWKPTVLYTFNDTTASGLSSGGGTLTGVLAMTLTGDGWKTQSREAAEQAFHLIAHESAHLWNGQLVANTDQDAGAWIHEGAADAMAADVMLALGVIDEAGHRARVEEAINRCATDEARGSVATALARGAIRQVYDCGVLMAVWTAAAMRRASPSATLFTVWHDLIVAARAQRGTYDQDRYFTVLRAGGVPDSVVTAMRAFLASADAMPGAVARMRAVGVPIEASAGAPPASMQQSLARTALIHLMAQACRRVDLAWGVPARTGAVPACAPFAAEHLVWGVSGHGVGDDGAALYDAVSAACAAGSAVTLDGDQGQLLARVPCGKPLPARPPWYRLGR